MADAQRDVLEGDEGTVIRVTLVDGSTIVDASSATEKVIRFKQPDGTIVEKTASFSTDGADGKIQYVAESGLFVQTGVWEIRGRIRTDEGKWTSSRGSFTVAEVD